jgi:NADH-quinone oxidoreductase subunit L
VEQHLVMIALWMTGLPLLGSVVAGLFGKMLGHRRTHRVVVSCIGAAFFLSLYLFKGITIDRAPAIDHVFYTWVSAGTLHFDVGFLLDRLSAIMAVVVLFVSFMVHIYTIGYMADDPGYQRFFSYVALFTFAMLTLVFADNFLLIFFGWEGVGLVSYLLIGFWFERESAVIGSLKAFLVNRVGDLGFLLGIAAILFYCHTLNYHEVFRAVPSVVSQTIDLWGTNLPALTLIAMLLFIGAMGKSAQVPLHVWLPESMEGPTPISALIHAATMVTAGIYMVARLSPIFEQAPLVLSMILVIGGTTAFFMGLLAVVQYDIKRVIAYSTISQLGYMAVALGASAYDLAIFHLITHAFFKALLFLAAGSVIIALHHEQDMRKMGHLALRLPITYLTFLVGTLALCAIPPFSGFYSKDLIIDAVNLSTTPGARYAFYCVLAGAFVTPLYMFRALFLTFHTTDRTDPHLHGHIHEPSWVVWLPLLLLAAPSLVAGQWMIVPMLFAKETLLGDTIFVLPAHHVMGELAREFRGASEMALDAGETKNFWFAMAGIVTAWLYFAMFPRLSEQFKRHFALFYKILVNKFGFDTFNQKVMVRGTVELGEMCYRVGDVACIDGVAVNDTSRAVRRLAKITRHLQTGYLYHYAFAMVIGLLCLLIWLMGR